ncbi:spore coat protein U domain-containing protein [Ideonella livida]|uniref:Fimbrial major subunit CsuA/B family protein n=1 Tax=Ideonella livida TaxID=2707176 RepID=A0A7C9PHT8_9BURK|nr:spore coat protein U domain-containing protein [Ideonella livida]NDY92129.1 fimbrial major subunit CsuA/B family protein [Ideonella livida]
MRASFRSAARLLVAAGLAAPLLASAADTATVPVTATVQGVCKFTSAGAIAFGTLDPSTTATSVSATVTQPAFWCTKGTSYTVTDSGTAGSANMALGGTSTTELIAYSFSYTATGSGNGVTGTALNMGLSATVAKTAFQNAAAGSYSGNLVLTINP